MPLTEQSLGRMSLEIGLMLDGNMHGTDTWGSCEMQLSVKKKLHGSFYVIFGLAKLLSRLNLIEFLKNS
jgi:hypothetical protein